MGIPIPANAVLGCPIHLEGLEAENGWFADFFQLRMAVSAKSRSALIV
jgi:hypothetical protein